MNGHSVIGSPNGKAEIELIRSAFWQIFSVLIVDIQLVFGG